MDKHEVLEIIYQLERQYVGGIMAIPDDNPQLRSTQHWYHHESEKVNAAKNKYDWEHIQSDFDRGFKKVVIADRNGISLGSLRNGLLYGLVDETKWKKIINARQARLNSLHKRERRYFKARQQFEKYNWHEVQKELDKGTSKTEICHMFGIQTVVLKVAVDDMIVNDLLWKKTSRNVLAKKYYHKKRSGNK